MKKLFKILAVIILLANAIVFAIAALNYYGVDDINTTLCSVVSGCAFISLNLLDY